MSNSFLKGVALVWSELTGGANGVAPSSDEAAILDSDRQARRFGYAVILVVFGGFGLQISELVFDLELATMKIASEQSYYFSDQASDQFAMFFWGIGLQDYLGHNWAGLYKYLFEEGRQFLVQNSVYKYLLWYYF